MAVNCTLSRLSPKTTMRRAFLLSGCCIAAGACLLGSCLRSEQGSSLVSIRLQGHTDGVTSARFSPDGQSIVSGSLDNTVRIWNLSDVSEVFKLKGENAASQKVHFVAFSPSGDSIIAGGWDRD